MRRNSESGFSLIEILMALILIAVLSAIAISAFINFRADAQDAAIRSNLRTLRSAISHHYAGMQLRCNTNPGTYPTTAAISANDVTTAGNGCSTTQYSNAADRVFVQGGIPVHPTGGTTTVNTCTDCNRTNATGCLGAGFTSTWCYNPATGEIWSDHSTTGDDI